MRPQWIAVGVGITLALAALLAPLPPGWGAGWRSTLLDLAHVPLFAALTLALGLAMSRGGAWPAGIALGLAAMTELLQPLVGRTGSFPDFLQGAAGVAVGVLLASAARRPRTWRRLAVHTLALGAVLAWPVAHAAPILLDAHEGHRDFPTLADFATERQLLRWATSQARLERTAEDSARLDFLRGAGEYPHAMLTPVVRDWSEWRSLYCSFTVPDAPLRLAVSLRGETANGLPTHYQFERLYPPGRHVVGVDLGEASRRASRGLLDRTRIYCVQLFIYRVDAPRTLFLHRVWLE